MNFNIKINQKEQVWNKEILLQKLTALSLAKKEKNWIHADLSVSQSNVISRFFWKIAKHIPCLRQFYAIDSLQTRNILQQLNQQVTHSKKLSRLYAQAVKTFNSVVNSKNHLYPELYRAAKKCLINERLHGENDNINVHILKNHLVGDLWEKVSDTSKTNICEEVIENTSLLLPQEDYGNKAARLSELDLLLSDVPGVKIPTFCGISHGQIQEHLREHYPKYQEDWNHFVKMKGNQAGFSKEIEEKLEEIHRNIIKAFEEFPFLVKEIELFIVEAKKNESSIMVRSTSLNEDTLEGANAGGNYSAAGVLPEVKAISCAIGQVVASYHSLLSLTQREMAKQAIDKAPTTPVLLQMMIGENVKTVHASLPKDIPTSGIAYSREILGRTDGCTQIQGLFGQNEATVRSLFDLDTFYVYPDGTRHEIIRMKEKRLVPDGKNDFITLENPLELQNRSCLSEKEIARIEKVSQKIQAHYKKPMDIEWVLDRTSNILFIVQARALVERFQMDPETMDIESLKKCTQEWETVACEAIVTIGGKVVLLKNKEEIIIDDSLQSAFNQFWKLAKKNQHQKIKMAVTKKPGGSTSHFACTLREMGVNVIYCPAFNEDIFEKKEGFIVVDPQQELLITGTHLPVNYNQLIKKGWFRHPIISKESIQEVALYQKDFNKFSELLMMSDKGTMKRKELQMLLDHLGSDDFQTVQKSRSLLLGWMAIVIQNIARSKFSDEEQIKRAILLFNNAFKIFQRLSQDNLPKLQRLHAAKRVAALLFQNNNDRTMIRNDSLLQLLHEQKIYRLFEHVEPTELVSKREQAALWKMTTLELNRLKKMGLSQKMRKFLLSDLQSDEIKVILMSCRVLESRCLSNETKKIWMAFALKIASTKSRFANRLLLRLINTFLAANIFDEWVNLVLPEALEKNDNAIQALIVSAKLLAKSTMVFEDLRKKRQLLEQWKRKLSEWAEPANYARLSKGFEDFHKRLLETSRQFFECAENDSLAKGALIKWIKAAFDLYDKTIKSLKGSELYQDKMSQATRFKELLKPYIELSFMWVEKIPQEKIDLWSQAWKSQLTDEIYFDPRNKYILEVKCKIEKIIPKESELRPSDNFNGAQAVINSGFRPSQAYEFIEECTLEDLFALAHQNTTASFEAIFSPGWENQLPNSLKYLNALIKQTLNRQTSYVRNFDKIQIQTNLIGFSYDDLHIEMRYNVPLKNHSAIVKVDYHRKTDQAIFSLQMMGHNLGERMTQIAENLLFTSFIHSHAMKKQPGYSKDSQELSASWSLGILSESLNIEKTKILLKTMIQAFEDTIGGHLKALGLELETLDNNNPEFWNPLLEESVFKNWLNAGAPYLSDVLKRLKGNEILKMKSFNLLGLKIDESTEIFEVKVIKAVLKFFIDTPETKKNEAIQEELEQYCDSLLYDTKIVPALWDHRHQFIVKNNYDKKTKDLIDNIQKAFIYDINLIKPDDRVFENYLDELEKFSNTSLLSTWARSLVRKKESFPNSFAFLLNWQLKNPLPGYHFEESQADSQESIKIENLQIGDKVLGVDNNRQTNFYGIIVYRNDKKMIQTGQDIRFPTHLTSFDYFLPAKTLQPYRI